MANRTELLAYDIGMHNGDDTAYYLAKGFRVVAVEANPALVADARERFAEEIASGQVAIEGCGIADEVDERAFYVNPVNTYQSSFLPPEDHDWEQVTVQTRPLSSILEQHGLADLIKIDIEHMDIEALRDLNANEMSPPYISSEADSFEVLLQLYSMGYRRFRLINAKTVAQVFGLMRVRRLQGGTTEFQFPKHSSGPFGNDIRTPWLTIDGVCQLWFGRQNLLGRGWYDVHAAMPPETDGMFLG